MIVYDDYQEVVMPLKTLRQQQGLVVDLKKISEIGTTASELQTYIRQYYQIYSNLKYLLLVGDAFHVPTLYYQSKAADWFYAQIDDDDIPEFAVGRLSGSNQDHIKHQVYKIIDYETDETKNTAYNSFVGIASNTHKGDMGEFDDEHIEIIKNKLAGIGYTQTSSYYAQNHPTDLEIINNIDSGCGLLFYTGLGTSQSWITTSFSKNDIVKLSNFIYPVIISTACYNGDYTSQSCFAEEWMQAYNEKPIGAVACLMSSTAQSWNPPMRAQDEMIAYYMAKIQEFEIPILGDMVMFGFEMMMSVYEAPEVLNTWILFGDPAMKLKIPNQKEVMIPENFQNVKKSNDIIEYYDVLGRMIFNFSEAIQINSKGLYLMKQGNEVKKIILRP